MTNSTNTNNTVTDEAMFPPEGFSTEFLEELLPVGLIADEE